MAATESLYRHFGRAQYKDGWIGRGNFFLTTLEIRKVQMVTATTLTVAY
jgi:hypothetical protein